MSSVRASASDCSSRSARRVEVAGDERVQRLSFDELHREEPHAVCFFGGVDRDDVGMVERGDRARFTGEALQPRRIIRHVRGQNLERHVASQPRIVRPVHFAHAAGPQ
jgi:hypothetical protein